MPTGQRKKTWPITALLAIISVAAIACSSPAPEAASAQPANPSQPASAAPSGGSGSTLRVGLASTDLGIGANRIAFGLIDSQDGPLRDETVEVRTFFLTDAGQEGPIETQQATFQEWPVSPRGIYTVNLEFDRAGRWGLGVVATSPDGGERRASATVLVKEATSTPQIGFPAPKSDSKTAADVDSLDQLTTDVLPDPDLYNMTIAEAIDQKQPLMVIFSTPAYCQTATCGPQLDVVKELKNVYKNEINVIHIEVYDNPHEIQGDLRNAVVSPTLNEWGLPSEPWTFIVDEEGLIQAKFEAFTTKQELEQALGNVLQ